MKNICIIFLSALFCMYLSSEVKSKEIQTIYSEFYVTFHGHPRIRSTKTQIGDVLSDVPTMEYVGQDEILKLEVLPLADSNYLKFITKDSAISTLLKSANLFNISNNIYEAYKNGEVWIAESKGYKNIRIGNQVLESVYKMKVYYGRRSMIILHAIAGNRDYPTKAILDFIDVRIAQ